MNQFWTTMKEFLSKELILYTPLDYYNFALVSRETYAITSSQLHSMKYLFSRTDQLGNLVLPNRRCWGTKYIPYIFNYLHDTFPYSEATLTEIQNAIAGNRLRADVVIR